MADDIKTGFKFIMDAPSVDQPEGRFKLKSLNFFLNRAQILALDLNKSGITNDRILPNENGELRIDQNILESFLNQWESVEYTGSFHPYRTRTVGSLVVRADYATLHQDFNAEDGNIYSYSMCATYLDGANISEERWIEISDYHRDTSVSGAYNFFQSESYRISTPMGVPETDGNPERSNWINLTAQDLYNLIQFNRQYASNWESPTIAIVGWDNNNVDRNNCYLMRNF